MLGITPYYQDKNCIIYHADNREVEIPRGCVDILFTDPPWGIKYRSNFRKDKFDVMDGDEGFDLKSIDRLLSVPRRCSYIMCNWSAMLRMPEPDSLIAWIKNSGGMGDLSNRYSRCWDMIAFYSHKEHEWNGGRPIDLVTHDRVHPNGLEHPTEKPIPLVRDLLSHSVGATVLDPYGGSGSTIIACKTLGRYSVYIDIQEKWCDLATRNAIAWQIILDQRQSSVN